MTKNQVALYYLIVYNKHSEKGDDKYARNKKEKNQTRYYYRSFL